MRTKAHICPIPKPLVGKYFPTAAYPCIFALSVLSLKFCLDLLFLLSVCLSVSLSVFVYLPLSLHFSFAIFLSSCLSSYLPQYFPILLNPSSLSAYLSVCLSLSPKHPNTHLVSAGLLPL